ncbi:hypothetical protein [Silvibacterium bohemicum]|nr:hypothetical protein [Silvibacterium bohemicum]
MFLALLFGQLVTSQDKPVIHLQPHSGSIDLLDGGKRVDLINAPPTVHLPHPPPKLDLDGNLWAVDVKNLGPKSVTVLGDNQFSVIVNVNQTVHIHSNGSVFTLKP